MTDILEKFKTALQSTGDQYHRLIILVNCEERGEQEIVRLLKEDRNAESLNLNLELATRLLEYSIKQRPLKITEIMEGLVGGTPFPALLDHIDILFEPSLKTDTLSLLLSLSKSKTIVVFWWGALKENKLYYAEPGYPEYKSYPVHDFVAIDAQPQENL
ncbi:MAG: BREX-3 system P-loop-containing protein BrxF [Candidatus Cloacimonetes bacterium]|nr:BREX-3 system P-loop-containing protein BrxF [Candidatus Cloacimonadota bacterium]